MEVGGYVALGLVVIEVMLIGLFVRGKPPISKGSFIAASVPIVFLAGFFWMGDRVTEMTIAGVGTIKTAATLANQYVEDIKNIKSDVERQQQQITAAVSGLQNEINQVRSETKVVGAQVSALEPRRLNESERE
jgi:hypothetical protein